MQTTDGKASADDVFGCSAQRGHHKCVVAIENDADLKEAIGSRSSEPLQYEPTVDFQRMSWTGASNIDKYLEEKWVTT
jgi:hypothetical protein